MAVSKHLPERGRDEPRHALIEQGRVHTLLAREFSTELAEHGWTADRTAELERTMQELSSPPGAAIHEGEAREAGASEWEAVGRAEALLLQLRRAVPHALRRSATSWPEAVPLEAPADGTAAGLSAHLTRLRPHLAAISDALREHFEGKSALEELDTTRRELDAASARGQAQIGEMPEDTRRVHELKRRLLELIEELNRAGRRAFAGDAVMLSSFESRILDRAKAGRRAA